MTTSPVEMPADWACWDQHSKDRLLARLRAETIRQGKVLTFCTDPTPSAMAARVIGDRWKQRAYHDVLDRMAVDMLNGDLDRGTISLPPQVGKSTWVNWFVAWWQAWRPTEPVIRMSYSADLATEHARSVQSVIEDHGAQWGLVPAPRGWKQNSWSTLTGAGLRSGGMLTGVAGFPAALMLIDDPFAGRAHADSKIIRDRTWNEYSASLLSRMRPSSPLLIVCCLTGDTLVLMADGTERPIRDVREGDQVATYEDGRVSTSTVKNWANQGPDHLYAIRMASGRTVRANARHPFLTVDKNGVEAWVATSALKPGMSIRGVRAVPGQGPYAEPTTARNPSAVRASAHRITTRPDGPQAEADVPQKVTAAHTCETGTASTRKTMTRSSLIKAESAQSASAPQPRRTLAAESICSSTTATISSECAGSCATTATSSSGTGQPSSGCLPLPNTYELTTDSVESVVLEGFEDVFDIEVDRTHNFVANSLVTHNTRWHDDDLVARAIAQEGREETGGRWRVINLPAIADREDDPLGRRIGEPLPHPWIDPADTDAARRHWEDKRRTSTTRDWFSLYQGDPKPVEGALLSEAQVKAATFTGPLPAFVITGVAVDPSGGGRDVAGVVGGGRTRDGKVIWTHDRSKAMGSDEWAREACLLAQEIEANEIVYEHNYGGDQAKMLMRTTWESLQREGLADGPCPRIVAVHAKKGKRVRAEPIAAQVILGNVMFHGLAVLDVGSEWSTWQEDSKESPGRIDASAYLAYRWVRVPGAETMISTVADKPKEPVGRSRTAARLIER